MLGWVLIWGIEFKDHFKFFLIIHGGVWGKMLLCIFFFNRYFWFLESRLHLKAKGFYWFFFFSKYCLKAFWMCFLIFHFGVHLYYPSLVNGSLHFHVLKSDLSWGSSHSWAGFIFSCSSPVTEVTSEVRALELFLPGFACLSWLVATLVFGSLGKFSVTASQTVFISWISARISFTSWANHLEFFGCAGFTRKIALFFWLLGYFFCHFYIFCSFYHPSCFWIGDILSMF